MSVRVEYGYRKPSREEMFLGAFGFPGRTRESGKGGGSPGEDNKVGNSNENDNGNNININNN